VRHAGSLVVAAAATIVVAAAPAARAEKCPTRPDDPICRPWSAVLLPTVYGTMYAPQEGGMFYGGGVELVLLAWSDNGPAFGPSQGRIRADIGLLTGSESGAGTMVMYRTGAQVAFERNASRGFLIPYFAFDLGGLRTEALGRRWFVDGGVGLYLVHRRSFIVDVEVAGVLPFKDPGTLSGVTTRLGLSFALW
jgi:hypothetical protein